MFVQTIANDTKRIPYLSKKYNTFNRVQRDTHTNSYNSISPQFRSHNTIAVALLTVKVIVR